MSNQGSRRLRLNDLERDYLLRLIHEDIKLQTDLLGRPIEKLIEKLLDRGTDEQYKVID